MTATPLYQRVAPKALHLRQLGLRVSVISRKPGATDKTVTKAIASLEKSKCT